MAELKYQDYSFDIDTSMNQPKEQMNSFVIEEVKRPAINNAGVSAANKLKRISLVEKSDCCFYPTLCRCCGARDDLYSHFNQSDGTRHLNC